METGYTLSKEGMTIIKIAEVEELINKINSCNNWFDCKDEVHELVERARDAGAELRDNDYEYSIYQAAEFFGFELD